MKILLFFIIKIVPTVLVALGRLGKFGKSRLFWGGISATAFEGIKNKEIYIIDFCYQKSEIMKRLLHDNKKSLL